MTELSIRPDEIRDALKEFVESYEPGSGEREEVGRVTETGDGIARVEGLPRTMTNELLEFEGGVVGLALNLDISEIGVVLLGDAQHIEEGSEVRRTGEILSVPVGDGYLGRVVDALGRPLDGLGEIESNERRPLELQAPSVVQRQPVNEPLQTGIKAIDAMTAIGRGQRQLIIGDRQTGKSAIALDAIINQRENWKSGDPKKQVKCIYVAIGQKNTTVAQVRDSLEEAGAMEYTTIVSAPAAQPAGFKYLAPYTGSALGQYWMYQGQHALIVFDDLTKQAEAYRTMSLLLRRPPGREAYPGDVFYLHSRLLERCAKLNEDLGAGSLTGLPIIETKGNDVSAFIPTNVISITDGQIFLETDLFNQGVRPAINVGLSVSRVGGNAQIKSMKSVAGRLRIDLAQYRELESFAAFGSDLDKTSRQQLERGQRLVELLKQKQYAPYPVERQVVSVWLGTQGHLDDVPVNDVGKFESEFLDYLDRNGSVYDKIMSAKKIDGDLLESLQKSVHDFKEEFQTSEGEGLHSDDDDSDAEAKDNDSQESIKKHNKSKDSDDDSDDSDDSDSKDSDSKDSKDKDSKDKDSKDKDSKDKDSKDKDSKSQDSDSKDSGNSGGAKKKTD
jgi:F-type H+-transporting ATPase subunit alpha